MVWKKEEALTLPLDAAGNTDPVFMDAPEVNGGATGSPGGLYEPGVC